MSSLPPISPRLAPNPAPAANAAAVRDARAMFFKALGEVPAAAPSAPAAKPAMVRQNPTASAQPLAAPTPTLSAEDAARPRRPGSLLNILV